MFKDEHRCKVWDEIRQHDLRAFAKRLTHDLFTEAAECAQVTLGTSPLYLVNLVWLGIASALHSARNFAEVLTLTMKLLENAERFTSTSLGKQKRNAQRRKPHHKRSKHDPRRSDPTMVSEEAFSKARRAMPLRYWAALLMLLGKRFESEHADQVRWNGFRLLAMDGTCINLPGWKKLKDYYGTAKNAGGGRTTQARMVMLQFPLVRLPYRYELAPLSVGETTLADRLVRHLQRNDLVLIDRGFWSYSLFWQVQQRQAYFGIRLKKGPKFKTLRKLGSKDRLVRWTPSPPIMSKWRRQGLCLPKSIDLRVIKYQIPGFRPSAVVTNMTDPKRISRDEWVRLTVDSEPGRNLQPGLYHRRWEIETTFKEMKVAQNMKRSLRSRTPEGIEYEIAGHVMLYLLVRWMILEAAVEHGKDPLRFSFTKALHELQDISPELLRASPQRVAGFLLPRLLQRIAEHIIPERHGRHFPRPNDTKPINKGNGKWKLPAKLTTNKG